MNVIYEYANKKKDFSEQDKQIFSFAIITLMKLMAPTTVHLADEIYSQLGAKNSIHDEKWPEFDEKLAKTSSIPFVIQVNGKTRDIIEIDAETSQEEMKKIALASMKVAQFTDGKEIVKTIVVPNRLVNIVVK